MSEGSQKVNSAGFHGLARRGRGTTSQFDVRGELDPVSPETLSSNRRTLLHIQSRSAGRKGVMSVPGCGKLIGIKTNPQGLVRTTLTR